MRDVPLIQLKGNPYRYTILFSSCAHCRMCIDFHVNYIYICTYVYIYVAHQQYFYEALNIPFNKQQPFTPPQSLVCMNVTRLPESLIIISYYICC